VSPSNDFRSLPVEVLRAAYERSRIARAATKTVLALARIGARAKLTQGRK